jgi:hypothetical protein
LSMIPAKNFNHGLHKFKFERIQNHENSILSLKIMNDLKIKRS